MTYGYEIIYEWREGQDTHNWYLDKEDAIQTANREAFLDTDDSLWYVVVIDCATGEVVWDK